MGLFDNLSEKLAAGGEKVKEKAKVGYEYATLTATVEKEKVVQEKIYHEIGKKLCAEAKDLVAEKCPDEFAKLEESIKKAEEAKKALEEKKANQGAKAEEAEATEATGATEAETVEGEPAEEAPAEEAKPEE